MAGLHDAPSIYIDPNPVGNVNINSVAGLVGSVVSIVLCTAYIILYRRYEQLHCPLNGTLCRMSVAQLIIAMNVFFSSLLHLAGAMNATLCCISATVDNVAGNVGMLHNVGFFVAVALMKRRGSFALQKWTVFSCALSVVAAGVLWTVIPAFAKPAAAKRRVYFTMQLAWCSFPSESRGYSTLSDTELGLLHFFLCFILVLLLILAAIVSFVNVRCVEAKASDWSFGKGVVHVRFFGSIVLTAVVFFIGSFARFHDAAAAVGAIASATYGLWGALNALIFFYTERFSAAHFYPRGYAKELPADGFAAVTTAMLSGALVGQPVPVFISETDRVLLGTADHRHCPVDDVAGDVGYGSTAYHFGGKTAGVGCSPGHSGGGGIGGGATRESISTTRSSLGAINERSCGHWGGAVTSVTSPHGKEGTRGKPHQLIVDEQEALARALLFADSSRAM